MPGSSIEAKDEGSKADDPQVAERVEEGEADPLVGPAPLEAPTESRSHSRSPASRCRTPKPDSSSVSSSSDDGGLCSSHETLEMGSATVNEITLATPGKSETDFSSRHLQQQQQREAPLRKFSQRRHVHKFRDALRVRASRFRSAEFLGKLFPCVGFARNYRIHHLVSDCIAGLTLALTVIPMGIGYAALAELPLQYGLYASIVPGFAYAIFGTCKEVTIGPTAVNALMSYNYAGPNVQGALTLAFFCGIIEMCAGFLNLGFLTNFISAPVIAAFTSAVSINVMTSQIKGLLGLNEIEGRGFRNTWLAVFQNIQQVNPVDATIGFGSLGIILFLRNFRNFKFCQDADSRRGQICEKVKWFVTVSRNSLVLIASSVVAYVMAEVFGLKDSVYTTGAVPGGIPAWDLPWRFGLNDTEVGQGPFELAEGFGVGLLMLPLVSMIQAIAIVHNFSPPTKSIDSTQEILALGICQFVGSFAGSLPVTASFGRSTVNRASGVKTPFGGIVTGLIVIAACLFLTPHFAYIPTAALAAVIISSVVLTIDIEILLPIWKSKKIDLIPYLVTFFVGVLWRVEWGMILGTLSHLCILLYSSSKPNLVIQLDKMDGVEFVMVQPDRSLNFPAVDRIRTKLSEATSAGGGLDDLESTARMLHMPIVFDLQRVVDIDFAAGSAVRALAKSIASSGQAVTFCGATPSVEDVLQGVDPTLFLSHANVEEAVRCLVRT